MSGPPQAVCVGCGRSVSCARMRDGTLYRPFTWTFPSDPLRAAAAATRPVRRRPGLQAEVEGELEAAPDLCLPVRVTVVVQEAHCLPDERLDGGEARHRSADPDPDEERVDGGIKLSGR